MEDIEIYFDPTGIDAQKFQESIEKLKKGNPDFNVVIDGSRNSGLGGGPITTLVITFDDITKVVVLISGLVNIRNFLEGKNIGINIPSRDIFEADLNYKSLIKILKDIFNQHKPA